ncbi:MAG: hypothetical protein QW092_06990 [Candidatus Korarchaeum sp.]
MPLRRCDSQVESCGLSSRIRSAVRYQVLSRIASRHISFQA